MGQQFQIQITHTQTHWKNFIFNLKVCSYRFAKLCAAFLTQNKTWSIWIPWASMFICGTFEHYTRLLFILWARSWIEIEMKRTNSERNWCLRSEMAIRWGDISVKSPKPQTMSSERWCWYGNHEPITMHSNLNLVNDNAYSACWVEMWNVALKLSWKSCRWEASSRPTNRSMISYVVDWTAPVRHYSLLCNNGTNWQRHCNKWLTDHANGLNSVRHSVWIRTLQL